MIAWFTYAHVLVHPTIDGTQRRGYPIDLSWTGPWWIEAKSLPHVNPWIVLPTVLVLLGAVYWAASRLWEPMGRNERHGA
jgi:hypothetical protein